MTQAQLSRAAAEPLRWVQCSPAELAELRRCTTVRFAEVHLLVTGEGEIAAAKFLRTSICPPDAAQGRWLPEQVGLAELWLRDWPEYVHEPDVACSGVRLVTPLAGGRWLTVDLSWVTTAPHPSLLADAIDDLRLRRRRRSRQAGTNG